MAFSYCHLVPVSLGAVYSMIYESGIMGCNNHSSSEGRQLKVLSETLFFSYFFTVAQCHSPPKNVTVNDPRTEKFLKKEGHEGSCQFDVLGVCYQKKGKKKRKHF